MSIKAGDKVEVAGVNICGEVAILSGDFARIDHLNKSATSAPFGWWPIASLIPLEDTPVFKPGDPVRHKTRGWTGKLRWRSSDGWRVEVDDTMDLVYVAERHLEPIPLKEDKPVFNVGDTVDIHPGSVLQFEVQSHRDEAFPTRWWKVVDIGGGGYYIRNGKFNAWARDIDLMASPKTDALIMRVNGIHKSEDGVYVTLSANGDNHLTVVKPLEEVRSIHIGDEYTVTIQRKDG